MSATTFDRVRDALYLVTGLDESAISMNTTRAEFLMDSLHNVEFVMELEEQFRLDHIPDDDCAKWATVKDICKYLEARTKGVS